MKTFIIQANNDLGVNIDGSRLGPNKITSGENFENIITVETVNVEKNNDRNNSMKNLHSVNKINSSIYSIVNSIIEQDAFPLTLGGDHSVAIGSALASINQHGNLGIIWIDSHGDFNIPETSPSGNIHGYPFAAVCGYKNKEIVGFHNGNFFNPKKAVLVGARDIDFPCEFQNLKEAGVTIFTTKDIINYGVDKIMKKAFDIATRGTSGVHVSYDVDAIDPKDAPGVSIRVPNGFDKNKAFDILDYIINQGEVVKSFDLVEFNPNFDIDNKTLDITKQMVKAFVKSKNGQS